MELLSSMSILDPQNLPSKEEDLASYRLPALDILMDQFGNEKVCGQAFDLPVDRFEAEWGLKELAFAKYKKLPLQEFWNINKEKYIATATKVGFNLLVSTPKHCLL